MTQQPVNDNAVDDPPPRRRLQVVPEQGSLLDDLITRQRAAAAAEEEARDRKEGLSTQIKSLLSEAHPGVAVFDIAGAPHRPAMTMSWSSTVSLDVRQLKADLPELYVQYAKFGGRWDLRKARGAAG